MSTTEEIREVFESEIAEKSRIVRLKLGECPFYDGFGNMRVFDMLTDVDPCETRLKRTN